MDLHCPSCAVSTPNKDPSSYSYTRAAKESTVYLPTDKLSLLKRTLWWNTRACVPRGIYRHLRAESHTLLASEDKFVLSHKQLPPSPLN